MASSGERWAMGRQHDESGRADAGRGGFPGAAVERYVRRPYRERCARYEVAADRLVAGGLSDQHVLVDVGSGHTELDVCLRITHGWRGRYLPVDRWTGGADLETWVPPLRWEWVAALEVLEHLRDPFRLLSELMSSATRGVVVTTPNPDVVDVSAMDAGHVTPITRGELAAAGLYTSLHDLYGARDDGICAVWYREGLDVVERRIAVEPYMSGRRP